jgi:hypothetical protein
MSKIGNEIRNIELLTRDFFDDINFESLESIFNKIGIDLDGNLVRKIDTGISINYYSNISIFGVNGELLLKSKLGNSDQFDFIFFPEKDSIIYISNEKLKSIFNFEKKIVSKKGGVSYVYSHKNVELIFCSDDSENDTFIISSILADLKSA